jgi:hypothetical protein
LWQRIGLTWLRMAWDSGSSPTRSERQECLTSFLTASLNSQRDELPRFPRLPANSRLRYGRKKKLQRLHPLFQPDARLGEPTNLHPAAPLSLLNHLDLKEWLLRREFLTHGIFLTDLVSSELPSGAITRLCPVATSRSTIGAAARGPRLPTPRARRPSAHAHPDPYLRRATSSAGHRQVEPRARGARRGSARTAAGSVSCYSSNRVSHSPQSPNQGLRPRCSGLLGGGSMASHTCLA